MLLLATKSCPPLMVDRYRGLKINTGKRKVSWHLTYSSAEIQLTLSRFTRLWFLLETELCLLSESWENIFISECLTVIPTKHGSIQTFFQSKRGRKWNENTNHYGKKWNICIQKKWDLLPYLAHIGTKLLRMPDLADFVGSFRTT